MSHVILKIGGEYLMFETKAGLEAFSLLAGFKVLTPTWGDPPYKSAPEPRDDYISLMHISDVAQAKMQMAE